MGQRGVGGFVVHQDDHQSVVGWWVGELVVTVVIVEPTAGMMGLGREVWH